MKLRRGFSVLPYDRVVSERYRIENKEASTSHKLKILSIRINYDSHGLQCE